MTNNPSGNKFNKWRRITCLIKINSKHIKCCEHTAMRNGMGTYFWILNHIHQILFMKEVLLQ